MYNFSVIDGDGIIYIPTSEIRINPYRPRKLADPAYIESLAASIRSFGLLQPIGVREINSGYELVFGECRLKAVRRAGLDEIPAVLLSVSDRDAAVLALLENIKRRQLTYLEQAEAVSEIKTDFECSEISLSHLLSEKTDFIDDRLAVDSLDRIIKKQFAETELDPKYACELVKLKDKKTQCEVLGKVKKYGLNIKRTRDLVENLLDNQRSMELFNLNVRQKRFDDKKMFFNTLKQAVDMLASYGLKTNYDVSREGEHYEVKICFDK